MRVRPRTLYNTSTIEAWPAWLLHARGNAAARLFARASYVLRRKYDGCLLAAVLYQGSSTKFPEFSPVISRRCARAKFAKLPADEPQLIPLLPGQLHMPELDEAYQTIASIHAPGQDARVAILSTARLLTRLDALDLDLSYGERTGLALVPEPDRLALAGFDRYRRPLWLQQRAARAWLRMQQAALREDIVLEAISGYRSHDYQFEIFRRKRARGQSMAQILAVNAAPGYSEHHSGLALDIGTPGEPPLETSFDTTAAFAWLRAHAAEHGFVMSYPRDNPHGIAYEPWHWCLRDAG